MSFQNKGFWTKNTASFPDSEIPYDNSSRDEPKRPHQWFLDASDAELFPIKKSAVEGSDGRPISGVSNVNLSWETNGFQAAQSVGDHFPDRLFGSELPRTIDFGGRNFQSISAGNLNIGRRGVEEQYGVDPSIGLSMSHTMEDPGAYLAYGGHRKVKVNQVKDPDSGMSMQIGNTFSGGDCNSICFDAFQEASETNPQLCKSNQVKDSGNGMSVPIGNGFNRFENNTISFNGFQDERETSAYSGRMNYTKDDENMMSMQLGNTFHKDDSNTISFGGFPVDGESNYDMLVRESSHQLSEVLKEREVADTLNTDLVVSATPQLAVSSATPKPKSESKEKPPLNSFPSNVRSLLNTGILDGVPVKYISWQREELEGVIKGCGYMCGCKLCKYSKVLNAYEFEKHAGAKTKHPNNHIFFENGKTVYSIVQDLKTTPPRMLFDAIEHCTGSLINQKAFKTWKESYQAASRELERIYGKDLLKLSTEGE